MENATDPRFRSAAIFAADGAKLKKAIQPKLKPLGWKSPSGWRAFERRNFQLAPPPRDFTPWTEPGGMIGEVDVCAWVALPANCEATTQAALDFIGDLPAGPNRNAMTLNIADGCSIGTGMTTNGEPYFSLQSFESRKDPWVPPAELLYPWLGCATCEYGARYSECVPFPSWTIDDIRARLGGLPRYALRLGGVSREQFARACDALKREVAGKVTWVSHAVWFNHVACGELFPHVTQQVPGYTSTSFFGGYAKGFDPYARPAAADAGETVRYPLVACKRPRLNNDGEKDLSIDIVHRPQGDCYFDIQAFSYNPPDDQVVHNTLAEAIASLDVPAEIWDGDPFLRWQ